MRALVTGAGGFIGAHVAAALEKAGATVRGFDIIEFGNAGSWNYAHTLVIARTTNEPVARDLAKVLETDNLIHLSDPLALVDATVIIGKDYEELSKRWQRAKL